MSLPAIQVEGLGKRYLLSHQRESFPTLRERIRAIPRDLVRRVRGRKDAAAREDRESFWAVRDVSFTLQQGERLGIVGRNGAGKSTLLKLLSRITEPTTGKIGVRGRVASLLEVGTGFHPDLTGRENIFLNGAILGMSRAEVRRKFDQIVAFAEVDRFLDTPVKRYSSGMYVRLAFAVAAHLTPEILIVDEVLAVGDSQFQKKCLGTMQDVSRSEGRTVLFVSHNMAAVQALCTQAMLMSGGAVQQFGDVDEIVELYAGRNGSTVLGDSSIVGGDFELLSVSVATPDASPPRTFGSAIIELAFRPLIDVLDAGANVLFEDVNGTPIFGLDSMDFCDGVRAAKGTVVKVRFEVDSLPLNPGGLRLKVDVKSEADHLWWEVPNSFDVHVEAALVYGSRPLLRKIHGPVAAPARVTVSTGERGCP